ncbi:hypothetical protein GTA08_BOTSDO04368 [Neofusicoccum parvum]|nr:hypothetical protein GTA08_BOTSDO04368 [Neofusicoccum parvum]
MRLTLTPHPHVYGHPPRAGGTLLLPQAVAPVDLEFLGLPAIPADEVAPPSGPDAVDEEEAFCERLRLLGAEWWLGGEEERALACEDKRPRCGWRATGVVAVGFEGGVDAGGGVWVYRVSQVRERRVDGDRATTRERMLEQSRRSVRVSAARTMEERCRVIGECGGEYFESVEAWRKVVLEEHVREGIIAPDRERLFLSFPDDEI